MSIVELFNRKEGTVVDSLVVDPSDDDAVNRWLTAKGLTLSDGEVMDVRTLPFGNTDLTLQRKGEAINPRPIQNPFLYALKKQSEAYRIAKNYAKDLIAVLVVGFKELAVREAIDDCRKNSIPEEDIIAVLGENANLAEGGMQVEMVVRSR